MQDLQGIVHPGKCRSVLIPMHVGGYHWVLGMFDMQHRNVIVYDSLGCKEPSAEQILIEERLPTLISQLDNSSTVDDAPWRRVYTTLEKQPHGGSSWIYMLSTLDVILRGYNPCTIRIASCLEDVRECIAEDLLFCGIQKREFFEAHPEFKDQL